MWSFVFAPGLLAFIVGLFQQTRGDSDILRSILKLTRVTWGMRKISALVKRISVTALLLCFFAGQAQANQPVESALWKASAAVTAALIAVTNPIKADRISAEAGGGEHVYVLRVGAEWDWNDDLLELYGWKLSNYWKLDFSKWQSTRDASQAGANVTVDLTPVFRFTGEIGGIESYADVGVGVALFSVSRLEDHEFGSNFQFSSQFALGTRFGERNQWAVGYKFQHYSNGSVREGNHGINFNFLTLSYKY